MNYVIIERLSVISLALPIIISLLRYRSYNIVLKAFSGYIYITGIFEVVLLVMKILVINNIFVINLYTIIEIACIGSFYFLIIDSRHKKLVSAATAITALFAVINDFILYSKLNFDSISCTLECFLFLLLSLIYFYQILVKHEVVFLEKFSIFWINSGVLFYFSGNLFLFMTGLADTPYWSVIHSSVNILANLVYAIGLNCKYYPVKAS